MKTMSFLLGMGLTAGAWAQPLYPNKIDPDLVRREPDQLLNSVTAAYETEFAALQKRAAKLAEQWRSHVETAGVLTSIHTNAVFLRARWREWYQKKRYHSLVQDDIMRDGYLRALSRDNELLRKAEKADAQQAAEWIADVALDLQLKADNCRHSADGLGKVIRVKVRTTRAGEEVRGLEVWFVQKGMFEVKGAHDRFRKHSSPTDQRALAPGGYAMWIRQGSKDLPPTTVRLGGRGETELEVDLEVP